MNLADSQEEEKARLGRERDDALEQLSAASEVLKVISSSRGELGPVFQTILENATRICEANFGTLYLAEGEYYRAAAMHNAPIEFVEFQRRRGLFHPTPGAMLDRTTRLKKVSYSADAASEAVIGNSAKIGGARSVIYVPLLKDDVSVGALVIYRREVQPFTEKQVGLLVNFASQAVVAIENTRLLSELRQRTNDLTESLEQQMATSKVLEVISRSAFDLQAVFETVVESSVRLCGADRAFIFRFDGEVLRLTASHNATAEFKEWVEQHPIQPGRHSGAARAALERRTIHISDVRADPEYTYGAKDAETIRTVLGVPILKGEILLGVLMIYHLEVRPFTGQQIALVETFADQAGIAIENAQLFDEVQQRTAELGEALEQQMATSEVLKAISSSLGELEPVFSAILENATRICEAKVGNLFLWDGIDFRAVAVHGESDYADWFRRDPMAHINEQRGTPLDRLTRDKKVIHIPNLRDDVSYREGNARIASLVNTAGARTHLVVPMLKDDELIGALVIYRQQVRPFTDKQIELVQNFAAQAVIAIENARLLSELRVSLQQQTATADVLKTISRSTFDLQIVLKTLVESAAQLCGAHKAQILRPAQREHSFYAAASYGHTAEYDEYLRSLTFAPGREGVVGRVLLERKPVQIVDVLDDPEYRLLETQRLGGFRTHLGLPLLREGNPIGILVVSRTTVQPFDERDIELLTTFADQAVIAIENARLFDEVQRRTAELSEALEQQTATADVLKVISRSAFDLKTVLQTLVESAARLCGADKATITRQIENRFYRAETYGFSAEFMNSVGDLPVVPERASATGRALLEGRAVHIPDVHVDPDYKFVEALRFGEFRTILGVPMLREGVPIGVFALTRAEVRPFTEKEIELVSTFADQAAIAIENARLFEAEQQRTRELAKSLADLHTAQDRLVQTEKLASLGQLTAGIAHEIKNPLNFVNNFSAVSVELLDELKEALASVPTDANARADIDEVTDTLRGNLEKIVQHGKRADSIVKNMLLHSREGSGEHRPVGINGLVDEALNLAYHGARAENKGFNIRLERSFDPTAGEADLYPQEITRVLLNLISNGFYAAIKRKGLTDDDGFEPTLLAATRNLGDRIEIAVRDNGTGIASDVKDKMFNPFFTTKPPGEGTGLGLSLSHDIIVKQHAGSIEVDTATGQFTEFRIVLPRAAATIAKIGERT